MQRKLRPCPHCGGELTISNYSEDGASVTEITCQSEACKPNRWHTRKLDSLYQGETSLQYNRAGCASEYSNFLNRWSL